MSDGAEIMFFQPDNALYRQPLYDEFLSRGWNIRLAVHTAQGLPQADDRSYVSRLDVKSVTALNRGFHWVRGHGASQGDIPGLVVLSWDLAHLSLVPAIYAHKRRGSLVALWGHGFSGGRRTIGSWARTKIARRVDAVLVYDKRTSATLSAIKGFPPVFEVGNGLQTPGARSQLEANAANRDRNRLLLMSRLDDDRGLGSVLHSLARTGAELTVIGEGNQRAQLERDCDELGVNATFVGAKYREEEIQPFLNWADYALLPRFGGLSFVHAIQAGIPVITENSRELHGPEFQYLSAQNSFLYESGNFETELQRAINLSQRDYDQISSQCLLDSRETQIDKYADRFEHVFIELLGERQV